MSLTINTNSCPFCGGEFAYNNGKPKCRYCGAYKTLSASNEETSLFYSATQKLRLADFVEAELEFDDIVQKYPENSNGYWGRLMAKYGIKYEQDYDGSRIPTCYATSIESIYTSNDYLMALKYADADNKAFYQEKAAYIERIRKEWIAKADKEKPYDIFICYKDSDRENGITHTKDSDECLELHSYLTEKNYRVFFSRVSLHGIGGEKYEPYIFNALSTAKIMIVYGSKLEYITSPWVKNEWTRYGKRIQSGEKASNSLVVAYKDLNPGDLPAPLRSRQCFDANSMRFYNDLTNMIEKIVHAPVRPTLTSDAATEYSNGLSYVIDKMENVCEINGMGTCTDSTVIVPYEQDGCPVTSISEGAFRNCKTLAGIKLLDGITNIGRLAFGGCICLKKVTLPKTLESIGDWAFEGCHSLTSLIIPESVTSIGEGVFDLCRSLAELDYAGTKKQWKKIKLHKNWHAQSSIKTINCSNGSIKIK